MIATPTMDINSTLHYTSTDGSTDTVYLYGPAYYISPLKRTEETSTIYYDTTGMIFHAIRRLYYTPDYLLVKPLTFSPWGAQKKRDRVAALRAAYRKICALAPRRSADHRRRQTSPRRCHG